MIEVDHVLLSDDVVEEYFVCDLEHCKGACCEEGDSGAPLDLDELIEIDQVLELVKPILPKASQHVLDEIGAYEVDSEGDMCTTTVQGKECVFALRDASGKWTCAIEKLYMEGKTAFRKPISCQLYPIRKNTVADRDLLNYHRWEICNCAIKKGTSSKVPIYIFLKDALIRNYGYHWYEKLVGIVEKRKSL